MAFFKSCLAVALIASVAYGSPAPKPAFWKGWSLDNIEEMRAMCASDDDAIACLKYKFLSFVDNMFKKDSLQLSDSVEINRNSFRANEVSARSESSVEDLVESYIQSHDVTFKLPGSAITVEGRNLDNEVLNFKVNFSGESEVGEARKKVKKSKLKKIIVPILVFILLKAMTLIPLALGALGLKAWNALQLSFFSFVISVALAVFQLCKKIAADSAPPQISAHGPWESAHLAARSFEEKTPVNEEEAQKLAYASYL
ncbi:uncharacterized protein LOC108734495 [Agrilus planipennis]|uniref:Uncharacterized protein LOC108734495 n=1 Tax=Agrilus planipennis TaxID=224129 RepID=A0A1W4WNH4_AGRPL|nr:uncharacterized protein LOC108734495 [Agrilus planipennis]